ncbi:MAG TPA: hypothetical protein DHV17_06745 [Chitinophagaceae bacterium]|nr:hypothetical protein [Chitinophagaceae bacterium]
MIQKHHISSFLFLVFLLFSGKGQAQNLSNRGVDFWVGYGHHQFMETGQTNSQEMVIYLSAEQTANVTIRIEGTAWVRNYVVPANTVIASDLIPKAGANDARLISLPCSFVPPGTPCGGEGIFSNKGIHITSDVPIVAYAHIYGSASSGATMLMPVETWGYSYVTLNSTQSYAANCFSWVYVIAKEDNTVIEVTPAATTRSGNVAGVPYTVTLNRGQIYQCMAGPEAGSAKPEMTGTKIRSLANASGVCNQIAVFAGSSRTSNPATCGSGGGDNDNQQCFPFTAWGKRYLTAPTSSSTNASTFMTNRYKIAVKDPTTVVTRNGVQIPLASLINSSYYQYESNTADYIVADKPIMVAQYLTGGGCLNGGVGDPEMMYISPIEQGIKQIGFYRNTEENITQNYLTLIIPTNGVTSLRIDGSATFDHTYAHPNLPGYSVVVKRWSAAQAQSRAVSDSAFTAITYGLGSVESYGYNAGTLINNLNAVGNLFNVSDTSTTTTSHPFTCTNTPMKLSALLAYPTPPSRIVWRLSQVTGGLSPNTDITDNSPTPVGTQLVNGIPYLKYELPGTYTFTDVGFHRVPLLATHPSVENCNNTEELYFIIEVRGKPVADFSFIHSGCVLDSVQFQGQSVSSNGFNINQWQWTFPGPVTASGQNTTQLFTSTGNVSVNLSIVSAEGCVADTTKTIGISAAPVVDFTTTPSAVCTGTSISFTDNSTYTGTTPISVSYWDFGDGSPTVNGNPVTHTYANPGTYTVSHTAGLGASCLGDTVRRVVTVYSQPYTTFTYPAGCLPATGVVQFNSTASAPDGQAIASHAWNFGDPGSGPNNTSALANPTHAYPTFGSYTITYTVTTVNGCSKDTTVNATFNLAPVFSYPALPTVCQNQAPISVAPATVTNAVPGSGVYQGPGTDAAGNFNPATAGPGLHTIWYVYTTTANCRDSVSQTIRVNPAPDPSFSIANAACLPINGNVAFTYDGTALPGQTYSWNFGDPGSGSANTSTLANPTHNYSTGTYTITLTVTANGCTRDSVLTNTFNLKPALAYPALATVCQNQGTLSVATASVTNAVPGNGVYQGPGTDAAGNFNPAAAGPGLHTIWYVYTSTANCVDSISRTIRVNPAPDPSFSIVSAACLPTNGNVSFTYDGTALPAQTYSWNFGDPGSGAANTSTLANPTHNYTTGTYTITLTVTANGCTRDSVLTNTFNITPALSYPALAAVCESLTGTVSVATATVTNGATGTGVYSGPGVDAAGNFSPSAAGAGTHTITYTFTGSGNCVSTITQTILVYAKPNASFSFPAVACLPTNGQVQFTYNGSLSAGQTYAWNFGDPASGANNTSTLQNPTHNYTNTGNYNVTVTVTNSNGCVDDSTINATFSVTPALSFPALTAVCESVAGTVSVATATVTNNVTGTGVYSGPGVDAAGNFSPSTAGAGLHTITYTFTSTGNCVASITQTIRVYPKPLAVFSITPDLCLGQSAQIVNSSSIPSGSITSWQWIYGDGNNNTLNNGNTYTYTYSNFGTYQVSLVTVSNQGCVSDTARQSSTVHAVPVAGFDMPASVCMPNGMVNFSNTSTVADGSALSYQWNFGDGNSSSAVSPGHVYASINTYTVTLTASNAAGCTDDSVRVFDAFFDKPIALFDASPDKVCFGNAHSFTDRSTAPNSSISTRQWTFGDGTTSTDINPTKTYAQPGTYVVELVVTNPETCISDPFRDTMTVFVQPVVDAGPSFVVPQGTSIRFNPTVNDSTTVSFVWSPATGLSDPTALRPTLRAEQDETYTLTATGNGNCTASDVLTVKILRPLKIPNVFSPNGDGINDTWQIDNLTDYTGAVVEVFNRYGQLVFTSTGYGTPWDGTTKGKPLPVATYYYVIQLKNGFKPLSGSVTIIR